MKWFAIAAALLAVAGCGVEGDPLRPEVSGTVSLGTNGVTSGASLKASNETFAIGIGL